MSLETASRDSRASPPACCAGCFRTRGHARVGAELRRCAECACCQYRPGSPPPAMVAPLPPASVDEVVPMIGKLSIVGKLQVGDRVANLERFLDLRLPCRWDEAAQARVRHDIEALGYLVATELRPLAPDASNPTVPTLQEFWFISPRCALCDASMSRETGRFSRSTSCPT